VSKCLQYCDTQTTVIYIFTNSDIIKYSLELLCDNGSLRSIHFFIRVIFYKNGKYKHGG
jgi:hypothetical protein